VMLALAFGLVFLVDQLQKRTRRRAG